jgi:hypothetical protein
MFSHAALLEKRTALISAALIQSGQQHTRGILIQTMDEPDLARRSLKAALIQIIAALKGTADFGITTKAVWMREHTRRLVDDHDETIPM